MRNSSTPKKTIFILRNFIISLLIIFRTLLADDPPFGGFDTPLNGSTVSGTISFTGWALDDVQVESLTLYFSSGSTYTYFGEAMFIEGSRPDIADAYPSYPNNTSAGWGYNFLSNSFPDDTYNIKAVAKDNNNNSTDLGIKTITINNSGSVEPFGTLDLPAAGDIISGSNYVINGWVLTPQPNSIPTDGSTITIYIDGSSIGHPTYNIYRENIANTFSGYANSNGAGFNYYLDTTPYNDGLHNINFVATDDAGNTDGLGARYFYIDNSGLPVELTSFEGYNTKEGAVLIWETATEVNNYGFEILRSAQNYSTWNNIGFVQGHGTTNSPKHYGFTDSELPNSESVDYRLKQIDNDGTFAYSKIVTVDLSNITDVDKEDLPTEYSLSQNYPNPFNPTTTIKFGLPERGFVDLRVYDILGQEVARLVNKELNAGYHKVNFGTNKIASGMYIYRINVEGKFNSVKKMLLLK